MSVTFHDIEQRSAEWFALRLGRITASQADLVVGKRRHEVVTRIARERAGLPVPGVDVTDAMQYGIDHEDDARAYYSFCTGSAVITTGFVTRDDVPHVGASPDGIVMPRGLVEIKCPAYSTHAGYVKSGRPPSRYVWQIQFQLWVSGLDWCDFVSYRHDAEPLICRVERCEKSIEKIEWSCKIADAEASALVSKLSEGVK